MTLEKGDRKIALEFAYLNAYRRRRDAKTLGSLGNVADLDNASKVSELAQGRNCRPPSAGVCPPVRYFN
jgi:hypothetical protein